MTWWPEGDPESYGGLLRDIDEGYSKRLAIVVPPGAVWPLPAYELAIMTAGEADALGHDDVQVTVVTPEHAPLSLFGPEASAAVAEELERAGVRSDHRRRRAPRRRRAAAGAERGTARRERVFAVPRLLGPAIKGLAADEEGFILTGEDGRVARRAAHLGGRRRHRRAAEVRRARHATGARGRRGDRPPGRRRRPARPR